MAKYNNQKAKILFLQQMLYESGENHTISMQMILDTLLEKGIRAERKSIYDDMDVLRFFGMDIRYRREKPSGYYLAGFTGPEIRMPGSAASLSAETAPAESNAEAPEETITEETIAPGNEESTEEPDTSSWMKAGKGDRKKQMKLLCTEKGRKLALSFFGDKAEVRRRDDWYYLVTAPLYEDAVFFGWITTAGTDVRILKPKKTAQAYREYLKGLIKDYKTEK